MLLRELRKLYHKELEAIYPVSEIDSILDILLEYYHGIGRFVLALQPGFSLTKKEEQPLIEALARLLEEEPVQYITGSAHFFGLDFKVNANVLIPRPETEDLIRWILEGLGDKKQKLNILDIGTGSGNIAISLASQLPQSQVYALDISQQALDLAEINARANQVDVKFISGDIRKLNSLDRSFNIIVSNPPYVRISESREMKNNVKKYEPWQALFVPDEAPLLFYECIANFGRKNLKQGGQLYLEINQYLGNEVVQLLKEKDYKHIELKPDLFGKDRMVKAVFNGKTL
ncbi:peptide chain release factor N(5)-glutamine methyltransferase [Lentiprolixibacter aurantiacus]|uniref:Release factor glutamine methyltransferase n=1 Tax=Lentiprolixibacter aurantiacus TaxID=2993939 RepID=A0AAE3ML30_9FLAO|nr:peptide chain release factor N(5)-glutamine methyltransferase [Lentiprolixibacter aurantiacus]MCX2719368.1 peptide chain release factor N(5)-glutamine methyltransferase [Lentiprolixibacter aurantiacus]